MEPKGQRWRRKGESFPARSPLPLNCTLVLCFSQVPPAPSPPTQPVNSPRSELPQRRFSPSAPAAGQGHPRAGPGPRPPLAGGAPCDPAPATPLPVPPPHTHPGPRAPPERSGGQARAQPPAEPEEEEKRENSVQEINRGRESTPHPKCPRPERRGATSLPATTRGALRPLGPPSEAISLGKARPSAFNSPGKKARPRPPGPHRN